MTSDRANVFDEVVRMLTEVIGDDFLLEGEVTPETTFADDLAVESVEFVALGEKLQRHYGERVDFVAFVAGMDIDKITRLSLGDLVAHIEANLDAPDPVSP